MACDRPGAEDRLELTLVVDSVGAATPSELLVRLDSLGSSDGPRIELESGFAVQAFLRTGPGRGCANPEAGGAELRAGGDQLRKAWVHLKADVPASIRVVRGDGSPVAGPVTAEAGLAVPVIRWGGP